MLYRYKDPCPKLGKNTFIAPTASIIGDVNIGEGSSIWFNVTIRGDVHYIKIGKQTNIQDNSILHVTKDRFPLVIGNKVTVGHGVILHGCTVEDNSLIGMGAIILDGAFIPEYSIVAAGSLVREGTEFTPGKLIGGNPARIIRALTKEEKNKNLAYARNYTSYKSAYLNENDFQYIEGD